MLKNAVVLLPIRRGAAACLLVRQQACYHGRSPGNILHHDCACVSMPLARVDWAEVARSMQRVLEEAPRTSPAQEHGYHRSSCHLITIKAPVRIT